MSKVANNVASTVEETTSAAIAVMDASSSSSNVTTTTTGQSNSSFSSTSCNNNNTNNGRINDTNGRLNSKTLKAGGPLVKWKDMEHLVAGVSGGVLSTLVLHPLDLVKIRFQVNEGTGVTARPNYTSFFHAVRSIVYSQGLSGLYQGVSANCVGAGAAWGIYFFVYNYVKNQMQAGDQRVKLAPTSHILAAAQAGVLSLLIVNPVFVAKTRLCLQYEESRDVTKDLSKKIKYRGLSDALVKIFQQEGLRGFYKGLVPGVFGVSHGVIQFVTYEEMKSMYNKYKNRSNEQTLKSIEYIAFAAASKMIAASCTYPYQVVRSRLQDHHTSYLNCRDVILKIWRNESKLRGLYKGFPVYMAHVTPNICIVLLVYEYLTAVRRTTSSSTQTDDWKT